MRERKITLLLCIIMAVFLLAACHRKEKEDEPAVVTVTPSPSVTAEATPSETPTPAVTEDAQEEEEGEEELTEEEAIQRIEDTLGEENYYFELLDDHLNVNDRIYYIFQVSDGVNVIEPNIIVDKFSGDLLCYNSDGTTVPFTEHPLYNREGTGEDSGTTSEETGISNDEALKLLGGIPHETLGLAKELKEYKIIYDNWPTNVEGVACIGINVYEKGDKKDTYAGAYYVAKDGSKIYLYDTIEDEMIDITPGK